VLCDFLDLPFDTTTPEGELMLTQMAGFSRYERRRIGERTRNALATKKRQAAAKGQLSPLGKPRFGLRREKGVLVINRKEYQDGQAICDWYSRGYTYEQIAWHLNKNRDKTATGRIWTESSVRRAWKSMKYIAAWLTEKDKEGKPLVRMAQK
jgi:DNA invertase Pin-like site-specific DNA recombinase